MSDPNTISCPRCGLPVDIGDAEPLSRVPCPACGERVRIARSFNHFELQETLGTGGMGTVYRARDTQLDRDVALKLLRKDLGPEYANQLQQEARITASVNHPHVVQVFSFGHDHDQYYLVMELVDRGTLDDVIAERKRVREADVLRAGIQVARGLRAAYQKGLIHRDVKPANLLFNEEGMAKISDSGLAGIAERSAPDPSLRSASHDALILTLKKSERMLRGEPEPWRAKAALLIAAVALLGLIVFGWLFFARPRAPAKATASVSASPGFDINREFADGRRQIIDGRYPTARATFARLASETKNTQPIYDWALLNQAVAALLDQQDTLMQQALHEVENAGTGNFSDPSLGAFLLDTARRANDRRAVELSDIPDHAAKPFALFLLGLRDLQL